MVWYWLGFMFHAAMLALCLGSIVIIGLLVDKKRKKILLVLFVVGMLIGVGGCSEDVSPKFNYYSDMDYVTDGYFDVQKFLLVEDQKFFEEQKPWIFLFTVSAFVLFPYEYIPFSTVPHIPAG